MPTHIEWTNETWNPMVGCDKISPGCKNCYAIRDAYRLAHNPNPKISAVYKGLTVIQGNRANWTGLVRLAVDRLEEPLHWRQPRMIFVNSMSDLFHERFRWSQLEDIFEVMRRAHWHTFQVLTKREREMQLFLSNWASNHGGPLPHVWIGVSVEDRKHKQRIDVLRQTPAAIRFVSFEPLLEDLGELNLAGIDWAIVGGESLSGARPMHPDWARNIRDQSVAGGVAFLFKQWGEWLPLASADEASQYPDKEMHESDSGFRWVRVGKKAAGREIDGREWSEFPKPRTLEASA